MLSRLKNRSFIRTFLGFSRYSRWLLTLMFISGIAMLTVLWFTDLNIDVRIGPWDVKKPSRAASYDSNWLNSHAYIPNILAGVTSFLVGAPVAAIFLATFTLEREERSARQKAKIASESAWKQFFDAMQTFCSSELLDTLDSGIERLYRAHLAAYGAIAYFIMKLNNLGDPAVNDKSLTDLHADIRAALPEFREAQQNVLSVLRTDRELQNRWAYVKNKWSMLDQYIRNIRRGNNMEWFDDQIDAKLIVLLSRTGNPLADLSEVIEFTGWGGAYALSSGNCLDSMENYAIVDTEILCTLVSKDNPEVFGNRTGIKYLDPAETAAEFLAELRTLVTEIDQSSWRHDD